MLATPIKASHTVQKARKRFLELQRQGLAGLMPLAGEDDAGGLKVPS